MSYKTPLARVIGLGSAKDGSAHWWWQRLTALALVPLTLWFTFSISALTGECFADVRTWMESPFTATLLIAFIVSLFYHAQLGLQVVVEDYLHHEGLKVGTILAVKSLSVILVISSTISILRVALG
ncbi:MAG: succinate dehydrogenase, hydrophobic membrane anchor protein [Acidiferrobacterales bacterium]|nr:succinate dehydrogenase, hydrophobic membrane anchor protein [Acidiferrobacterales bacterium]